MYCYDKDKQIGGSPMDLAPKKPTLGFAFSFKNLTRKSIGISKNSISSDLTIPKEITI
jgi:hypothetical protein